MTRSIWIAALALVALAQMAVAQDKAAECALQTDVVTRIVAARVDGSAPEAAIPSVASGLTGEAEKYAAIVPDLAAWIYSLPEDQLTDAVAQSWAEACLAG